MANPYVGTVAVTYTVTPSDKADTYPVVGAEHVKGGLRQVENTTALNAIFDEHKVEGMIVYVVEDGTFKMWMKDPTPMNYGYLIRNRITITNDYGVTIYSIATP